VGPAATWLAGDSVKCARGNSLNTIDALAIADLLDRLVP
jgi:hypothetical protein